MIVCTLEQRWEILRHYFENHANVAECVRKLRMDFGRREAPLVPYVRYLVKKVKETGILIHRPKREKPKTPVRTPENISVVVESVNEVPATSIHSPSQQLNISKTSLRQILHKDLGMTPYKVQLVHELKPIDHPMRFRFAKWPCDRLIEDPDFGKKKNIFSDEAHFDLGGYVNKQNCRIWGTENPHAYIAKPMHPKRVTVWCGFWSSGPIMTIFFENEQEEVITVNVDRYRATLNEFLFTKIEEEDIGNIWFQQDGATCHTSEATLGCFAPCF